MAQGDKVSAAQAALIAAAFPQFAGVASKATVGPLLTQTVIVPTATVVKHRKVILPNGQTVSISE